ncbi:serine hydrolase domain-containing protein [Bacteroidota bacterium]
MKLRNLVIALFTGLLTLYSCEGIVIDDPVETCTFNEAINSATNPNNYLYQDVLDEYVELGIPGVSVAIETPENGWWVGCAGVASIEDQVAMNPCHIHHSSSMIKPYTATMIMRLYEDGLLDLDDPIRNYLPQDLISKIANGDEATIRHLLSHTSGIIDETYNYKSSVDMFNNPEVFESTEYIFENYAYGKPAAAAPGEEFHYTNIGFSMLGMIIEKASQMSLGEYFQNEIIDPLGLVNTYYKASPGYPVEIPNRVSGYAELFAGQLINVTDIELKLVKISMGDIGLFSTPYEFARFYQELIRGNILDSITLEVMLTKEAQDTGYSSDSLFYCLGIYNNWTNEFGNQLGHGGLNYGSMSKTRYFPDSDITLSVVINLGYVLTSENTRRFNVMVRELQKVAFTGKRE